MIASRPLLELLSQRGCPGCERNEKAQELQLLGLMSYGLSWWQLKSTDYFAPTSCFFFSSMISC
jgi:hypothetical protein